MATIKDIAKEAGVSVTTVSNVIHNTKSRASKETVERIRAIIEKYHYVPNMSARALVSKNSKIIGVLTYAEKKDIHFIPEDPFLGILIRSMEMNLTIRGYFTMVQTVSTLDELLALRDNWNFAGIIVHGLFEGGIFNQLTQDDIPCVLIDSYIQNDRFYTVGVNDFEGGRMATAYLASKGHKNIAFVSPTIFETGVVHERFMGYKSALEEAGVAFSQKNVYQVSTLDVGFALGQKIAECNDITAIFATADLLALGVIAGLQSKGISVPGDKSVIGFDDLYGSPLFNPPLTTIRQSVREKGVKAVDTLIDVIEGKTVPRHINLPLELIERGSVKAIN